MAWVIKYTNVSSKPLKITKFGGMTEAVVGETNHEPAEDLGIGGSDYLSLDQNSFKFLASGEVDFYQGVYYMYSGVWKTLWVRICVPLQVFGIGDSPYWYYLINDGADPGLNNDGWKKHDSDSVTDTLGKLKVKFSPVKDHTTITVSVSFDD